MIKKQFHDNWLLRKEQESIEAARPVILPHDAMIHEKRQANAAGGSAHGYFPGGRYIYEKKFIVPGEWKEKRIYLEFEGIYKNSVIRINGEKIGGRPYGYVPFLIKLDKGIKYGKENVITVEVDNSKLPNSRWYTGSGIYRPANLMIGNSTHIKYQGVKITTLSYAPAKISVAISIETEDITKAKEITVEVMDEEKVIAEKSVAVQPQSSAQTSANCEASIILDIPDAKLWSDESPHLYLCRVTLKEDGKVVDEANEKFGIRMLSWNKNGFFVNGKETLLRGGCVHHDNGILGAASWEKSEWRRVRIMKEAGFNAIRSAHNPASEAMLRACDAYGLYVLDESFDTWYNRKNKYDYGCDFNEWWQADTAAMVERDYNHPSVIMYSIGNEVAEPFEKRGVKKGQEQIDLIRSIDTTRPVTCGTNLMILGNAAKGKGVYQDGETHKAASEKSNEPQKEKNNSLAFNIMASLIGSGMNKAGNSKRVDEISTPFLDSLDMAGYNYGSGRYPLEAKAHPERIIFGSETFPQDIWKNWEMVKKYPYLIGDFMWTAWDYLGESGLGAWSYTGGMPFDRPYPWLLAGAGVIDILGIPDASCRYAAVTWDRWKNPVIGVRPANHPGVQVSKSVWRGTNAIESWAWNGCDGNKTIVEVYAQGTEAELLLNGEKIGKKKLKECKALFKVKYAPGELTAVVYDAEGRENGRSSLASACGQIRLDVQAEETAVKEGDVVYVDIAIRGENGIVESNADRTLTCSVTGGLLLGFGSANPQTEESFVTGTYTTYYGRAQAVVYAKQPGEICVKVSGGDLIGETRIAVEK
ncbi:MAG: glycoside hydrolase family 2 TIM barrel-domain containing protein [Roseburia sp.]